ncbi:hypothetical protein GCM10008018_42350 [Paenibacillus marchantiophytorum]|uniref:Ricin B lectin domain-containing protein n=1 Tax=Paenibacillus marchantiophytorum TaxID=1619310 RepID=A0ABQ1EXG5_9BACL|nr:RICIN domain-containing protein [Paenibacillus marchantiophytorum]GFZ91594.1 hypothetical protein GCM10008018_42350 [Paenibacillus marchantiophytorum]
MNYGQGNGVRDDIHFIDIRTEKIHNNGTSGQFRTAPILVWTAKYGDLKMDGSLITNASQGVIDIGANTSNITFNTNPTANKMISANSGKAVEVFGGSTTEGAKISQWDYHGGKNQRWQLVDVGNGFSKLIIRKRDKVLDSVGSTADGARPTQWTD